MSVPEQAGQLMMVGIDSNAGLSEATATILTDSHVGSVLLLQNTERGVSGVRRLTDQVRSAAPTVQGTKVMLAADQEGGLVQRLQGPGFDTIPSAAKQSAMSDQELSRRARTWGNQLRSAGIDLDLAPVADVVPAAKVASNEPVGKLGRGYGSDPQVVGRKVNAFIDGMDDADVATSVKHFPGLGEVVGNTDFASGVVDKVTTADSASLDSFAAALDDADSVMISTATYTRIDPDHRAAFSSAVITDLLRKKMGWQGVVISDDLGAAKAVADLDPGERAVQFVRAGGDIVINADPSVTAAMTKALVAEAKDDPEFADALTSHVTRVLELKADQDLVSCDD